MIHQKVMMTNTIGNVSVNNKPHHMGRGFIDDNIRHSSDKI